MEAHGQNISELVVNKGLGPVDQTICINLFCMFAKQEARSVAWCSFSSSSALDST